MVFDPMVNPLLGEVVVFWAGLAAAEGLVDDCLEPRLDLAAQVVRALVELPAEGYQLGLRAA
jgi:hypothetical protein